MATVKQAITFETIARKKLSIIRDEAAELSAIMEFATYGDFHEKMYDAWTALQTIIGMSEEIMHNSNGELSL